MSREGLEPLACQHATIGPVQINLSVAISLKRIADALSNEGSARGDLLHWLETISMDIRAAGR